MTPDQIASLAQSLKDNEVFQQALTAIRDDALNALATMPRSDEQAFYSAQARVAVVDDIRGNLDQFIRSGAAKKPPGLA
jgi:hypothetical protein